MKLICSNCQTENNGNSKYCSACGYELPLVENEILQNNNTLPIEAKAKKKIDLKTTIGIIIGVVFGLFVTQNLFKPSVDSQLMAIADEMNKSCPMTIDQYTTLKNVIALPKNTIQYNYILVQATKAEVVLDTVKKYAFPILLEEVKTNPGLKSFRDKKVTINYYYSDKNGEYVTEYAVTPEMYK